MRGFKGDGDPDLPGNLNIPLPPVGNILDLRIWVLV